MLPLTGDITALPLLHRLSGSIRALTGWRHVLTSTTAGAVSVLAMAPFFLGWVLFITLPVFVWLIDGNTVRCAAAVGGVRRRPSWLANALTGWLFGAGYFLAGLFWIGEAFLVEAERFAWALPFAVTLMPAGLALFYAAAAAMAGLLWRSGWGRVGALALAFAAMDWLRGHILTGFPWNVLGYALTWPLPLMQTAALVGVYALTLVAVLVFALPLVALADASIARERFRSGVAVAAAALSFFPVAWLFGIFVLARPAPAPVDGVTLRLVQPSVPQREKWKPENQGPIFFDHIRLSRQGPYGSSGGLDGITHVVWPEAAMPFLPLDTPQALTAIGELLPPGTRLLAGALRIANEAIVNDTDRQAFNSLIVFGPSGQPESIYDKIHLVPFGEYLPLKGILGRFGIDKLVGWRGGFTEGTTPRPLLHVPGLPPMGVLICYEAVFPGAIVQTSERPSALLNITNDGWFGNTTGPHQHFHQARVRAVEEGLALVRVANNGISAVIDARGRVLARLGLNERGVIDTGLPGAVGATVYSRFGDGLFLIGWLIVAAALAMTRRQQLATCVLPTGNKVKRDIGD